MEEDKFAFGFNTKHERSMIICGSPWLYNKQSMLVLEEVVYAICYTVDKGATLIPKILDLNQKITNLLHDETYG